MDTPPESPTSPTDQAPTPKGTINSSASSPGLLTPRLKLPLKKLSLPLAHRGRARSSSVPTNALTREQPGQDGGQTGERAGGGAGGRKLGGGSAKTQSPASMTPSGSRTPSLSLPERTVSPNTAIAREAREIFATPMHIDKPLCPGQQAAHAPGKESAEGEGKKAPCSGQVEQECGVM